MAAITASMVAELRAKTDAPMMECKKALTEAEGNLEKAEEILRVKLGNKAGKAAARITAEGVIASFIDGTTGALVEVNCETDFVSKNDDFLAFTNDVAKLIATQNPADVAALSALSIGDETVEAVRTRLIGKIGENMTIRRFKRFEGTKLASYLHGTRIGVMVAFEAAVAGGIPIIKALREGLTANRIEWIAGIINGTTNFILSEMRDKGLDFDTVLKEAQRLGYAEADPTFDIEGFDAAHKLTLMCAIAFGVPVQFERAYVEGITKLEAVDIRYAEELGYRIKLLGLTRRTDAGIELRVHPTLVPAKRLIANVEGAMNAVVVNGDAVGPTLYYGKGAGAEPTASAVVADLVDVTRLHTADPEHRVPHLAFQPDALSDTPVLPIDEVRSSYYLRIRVADETGVLADITRILAEGGISIDAMLQKESREGEPQPQTDIIMLSHVTVEKRVNTAIAAIEALPTVLSKVKRIRMEELN